MNKHELLKKNIHEFENLIEYKYKDINNAIRAFTHSSYANEVKDPAIKSNERLEFLGDAVLNVTISDIIYRKYPDLSEGEMTRIRASIVCEPSLMQCAIKLKLGEYIMLGKGEELTGGRNRASILADAFESVIGSIYIDGGMRKARSFILKQMKKNIEDGVKGTIFIDYKTSLQELIQKKGEAKISYRVLEEKGPDHNKVFVVEVSVDNKVLSIGEGKSKKEAEQNAAMKAFNKIKEEGD